MRFLVQWNDLNSATCRTQMEYNYWRSRQYGTARVCLIRLTAYCRLVEAPIRFTNSTVKYTHRQKRLIKHILKHTRGLIGWFQWTTSNVDELQWGVLPWTLEINRIKKIISLKLYLPRKYCNSQILRKFCDDMNVYVMKLHDI